MEETPTTYLITGGAGFIGSHLCDYLVDRGNRVLAIDDLSTGRMSNIEHLQGRRGFHFCRSNIMSEVALDRLCSEADTVIHLAASVGVEKIIAAPSETIENNVRGTEVVLQAALRYGSKVVLASTSEVYGKGSKIPFHEEDDVLIGSSSKRRWSYAVSKLVDEFLGLAYHSEHGLPVTVVRFFNTVGPRQTGRYGMVVPRLMQQALNGDPVTVYGDGRQSRCFCNVSDVIRAVVALVACPEAVGRVVNIGSTEEVTIRELAERTISIAQSRSAIEFIPYEKAYEPGFEDMMRRVPDTTRIRELIGWSPQIPLAETLAQVADERRRAMCEG